MATAKDYFNRIALVVGILLTLGRYAANKMTIRPQWDIDNDGRLDKVTFWTGLISTDRMDSIADTLGFRSTLPYLLMRGSGLDARLIGPAIDIETSDLSSRLEFTKSPNNTYRTPIGLQGDQGPVFFVYEGDTRTLTY